MGWTTVVSQGAENLGSQDIPGWQFVGGLGGTKEIVFDDASAAAWDAAEGVMQDDVVDGDGLWSVSSAAPRSGAWHFSQVGDGHNFDNLVVGTEAVTPLDGNVNAPAVGIPNVLGERWRISYYARLASIGAGTSPTAYLHFMNFDSDSNYSPVASTIEVALTTSYTLVQLEHTVDDGTRSHWLPFIGWEYTDIPGDVDFYVDDILVEKWTEVIAPGLYTRLVGYRLPYPAWTAQPAIEINMQNLMRQLEEYLHAHEITTPEVVE